jgi:drug/metabolite transporter (DMT)-like permease
VSAARAGSAPFAVLAVGVVAVSTSSILVRYAQAETVTPLAIAALRLLFAALLLTPFAAIGKREELARLTRRDLLLGVLAGLLLAVHFASWITSLYYTSIASSVALATTNPLWIAVASWLIFDERPGWRLLVGIGAALLGTLCIFATGPGAASHAPNPLLGNALALGSAVAISGYLLIGRRLRARLSLLPYVWVVYGSAALALVAAGMASGQPLAGLSGMTYFLILLMALGPQLLGHTAFNWALQRLAPAVIALAILGEPVGSALLAWLLFGEILSPLQLTGFALVLAGIYVGARPPKQA